MPRATITREETAHTSAAITVDKPTVRIERERTGRVTARIEIEEQGVP